MTEEQRRELANAQSERLNESLKEWTDGSQEEPSKLKRAYPSNELAQLIGHIVIAASWAEDAGGILVHLQYEQEQRKLHQVSGKQVKPKHSKFGSSGKPLRGALEGIASPDLLKRFADALERRNFVVHGFFLDASHFSDDKLSSTFEFVSMKRGIVSNKSPEAVRDLTSFSCEDLQHLAEELWSIEEA
ncbi:hypothetical protein ACPEH9_22580, partial [Providencia sp. NPDC089768]|uniref:hypothetical protein n=1 Tax=Providencia sp. NPDC089768 TaxID=3414705 RepID=UPI003C2F4D3B